MDLDRSSLFPIEVVSFYLHRGAEEHSKKPVRQLVSRAKFEPSTSKIQVQSLISRRCNFVLSYISK
jgi:hypothetical protein